MREAEQRADTAEESLRNALTIKGSSGHIDEQSWVVNKEEIEFTGQELGKGGWAIVKVAKFRGLQVAAKCLHNLIVSSYNRQLFAREMSIASRVRHPNLVQFLGATVDGEPTILMEKMYTSLRSVLERRPFNPPQITSIGLDVARALNYLHLMQPDPIIHRDISSANVLLDPGPDNTWKAKVSDYGSANLLLHLNTSSPGSPVYAAPEAGEPTRQSPKMDVYSYGVLLLEMCTRTFPNPGNRETLVQTVRHPRMATLIQQCLQQEPKDRLPMTTIVDHVLLA